jgi:transcription elongation GreA/GreB family factor
MSGGDLFKRHVAWIEQDKLEVSEKLFGFDYQEKVEYEQFMEGYLERVKTLFENEPINGDDMKYVTISSVVTVFDEEEGERLDFKIVSPNEEMESGDIIPASYLSKVGRALLLRAKNERIEVTTPQGVFYYRIEDIKLN